MKKLILFVLVCTCFTGVGQSVRDVATQDIDTYDIWFRPIRMARKVPIISGQTVTPKQFLGNLHLDTLAKKVGMRVFGVMNLNNTLDIDKPVSIAAESRFGLKVDKIIGKALSSNDFANNYKIKLDNLDNNFSLKASRSYVDSINNLKASIQSVGLKSERAYVDAIFSLKADVSSLNQKLQNFFVKTGLIAFTDSDIANFDGSQWERKAGNIASNGGAFAGTIIHVSASFYWERKFDFYNPMWWGVVGNGVADDTQTINNCIQYVCANNGGLINFNKNSTYKILGTVLIGSNITVDFNGSKVVSNTINSIIPLFQTAYLNASNILVNNQGQPVATNMVERTTIRNAIFNNCGLGFRLYGFSTLSKLENIEFFYCRQAFIVEKSFLCSFKKYESNFSRSFKPCIPLL